jgi:hypothetical protein
VWIRFGESSLICKLDLKKTYDHVNWDFLLYMLERCGFGERWRGWIHHCVSTVRLSVLIKGASANFFSNSQGVRQGDPLSPLLFVLVMEVFSRMMNATVVSDHMSGFPVGSQRSKVMVVPHLLFVDDTFIFCEPNVEQLCNLRCLLLCFEAVLGLKINLSKFVIAPIGEVGDVEGLSRILRCGVDLVPFTYLGLPLGAHYKDSIIWNNVIEKMVTKLAGWKQMYLSKGGRVTMIKNTL